QRGAASPLARMEDYFRGETLATGAARARSALVDPLSSAAEACCERTHASVPPEQLPPPYHRHHDHCVHRRRERSVEESADVVRPYLCDQVVHQCTIPLS